MAGCKVRHCHSHSRIILSQNVSQNRPKDPPDNDIYVMGNALNVNNTLTMNNHNKVIVWENGVLNLDDATIDNAKVIVKDGGLMNISNDGEISLGVNKSLKVDVGGRIYMTSGRIQ